MVHRWLDVAGWTAAALLIVAFTAAPATAQNTINQTTCGGVNGVGSCLTNGFLQDLTVSCTGQGPELARALAQITDRNGPNRITLSGNCGGIGIVGFNRLTIVGDGSPVGGFWLIANSQEISLRSINFDFSVQSGNVVIQGSQVTFDGITVTNARGGNLPSEFGVSLADSTLEFTGAPSLITNNPCVGISVDAGSQANFANVTISNNGLGQGCGGQRHGVRVRKGGSVNLANRILVIGQGLVDAPLDISGNGKNGIAMEGGTLTTSAEGGSALIHIHHNVDTGLEVVGSADVEGHVQFDNNHMGGGDPLFPGPLQIVVAFGGSLGIGGGVSVQGGLAALFNASLLIGNGGPMTITGGGILNHGSTALMGGQNTIDTLTCDDTSWAFNADNQSVIGTNTCPSAGPRGGVGPQGLTGPPGPQGPQGLPGGISGLVVVTNGVNLTIPKQGSASNLTSCPAGKVAISAGHFIGNANPNLVIDASRPAGGNAATAPTGWVIDVRNLTNQTQTVGLVVDLLCAFAQ
ncbi:MAG: hypothetical protein ACM36C_11255 [Acidobacteriota bacterium]